MDEVSRRCFLSGAGMAAACAVAAVDEKLADGGYAEVSWPVEPARAAPLLPPGARGADDFALKCVGCRLCVANCPNQALRADAGLRPEMHFDRGYCRPECTACGDVCPSGAIRKFSPQEKRKFRIGTAVWHAERCLAATEGVTCTACARHCPAEAITLVPLDPSDASSPKTPRVDASKCIGCGACEHLCPARPVPAMSVLAAV